MNFKVEHKPLMKIYNELGLEDKGRVQQFLGKTVADNLKAYVSYKSGVQEQSTRSINGGEQVEIGVLYAQFQAGGKVMVGIKSRSSWARKGEKKVLTGKDLRYHSDRKRGAHPFERMKADKRNSILNQVAKYARGLDNG